MKTVKKIKSLPDTYDYKRITEQEASNFIRQGWMFCGKEEWKACVRDINKEESNLVKPKNKGTKLTRSEKRKNKMS